MSQALKKLLKQCLLKDLSKITQQATYQELLEKS